MVAPIPAASEAASASDASSLRPTVLRFAAGVVSLLPLVFAVMATGWSGRSIFYMALAGAVGGLVDWRCPGLFRWLAARGMTATSTQQSDAERQLHELRAELAQLREVAVTRCTLIISIAVWDSSHVCFVTQQACLLCETADISTA